MIKPTDLRVNNILIDARSGTLLKVENLSNTGIYFTFVDEDLREPLVVGWQAEGIPLTPEVMGKCGFIFDNERYDGETGIYRQKDISVYHEEDQPLVPFAIAISDDGNHCFITSQIRFLHQLQNLFFALTGEELNYTPS